MRRSLPDRYQMWMLSKPIFKIKTDLVKHDTDLKEVRRNYDMEFILYTLGFSWQPYKYITILNFGWQRNFSIMTLFFSFFAPFFVLFFLKNLYFPFLFHLHHLFTWTQFKSKCSGARVSVDFTTFFFSNWYLETARVRQTLTLRTRLFIHLFSINTNRCKHTMIWYDKN